MCSNIHGLDKYSISNQSSAVNMLGYTWDTRDVKCRFTFGCLDHYSGPKRKNTGDECPLQMDVGVPNADESPTAWNVLLSCEEQDKIFSESIGVSQIWSLHWPR